MTKITFELKDELDEKFRKVVADRKGLHKGVIGEALEEAIRMWIEQEAKRRLKKDE
jgi:hypothetical protein